MKLCHKCCRAIQPGELYDSFDKHGASGGGITVHLHVVCPPPGESDS